MSGATPEMRQALASYVGVIRARLSLQTWRYTISTEQPSKGATAEHDASDGIRHAVLRFADEFWRCSPAEQRESVVHELLHSAHQSMSEVIRDTSWARDIGQSTYDTVWSTFRRELELFVDYLAVVVAPMMPLPELPAWPGEPDGADVP